MRKWVLLALSSLLSIPALAQDESSLDEVVVTGTRISYEDLNELPAASIIKPGDYLSLAITLSNDTRDPEKRHDEMRASVRSLLQRAGSIEIRGNEKDAGDQPLSVNRLELQFDPDGSRADVSNVYLTLRVKVDPDTDGRSQSRAMRKLLEAFVPVGRTEISSTGTISIGILKPGRFRQEILEAIATDLQLIRSTIGECEIAISGLNNRVRWQRASTTELLLYIPYSIELGHCAKVGKPASQ